MKKFLLFFIVMFLGISSVNAQTPTIPTESSDVDGLFGKYFARMVKTCQNADEVVIGFNNAAGNFGKIVCEKIANILGNIPGGSTVNIGNGNGNIHVVVNGKITQTEKPNEGDSSSVVTMELLNEILKKRVPKIEVGTDVTRNNGRTFIRFKKRFDTKPLVIAMPVGYNYSNRCRGDSFSWNTVVNPTDIQEDGFYVEKKDHGGCGGSLQSWGISYVAVSNVDNISTNYLVGVEPEDMGTEEVDYSGFSNAFKAQVNIHSCNNNGNNRCHYWEEKRCRTKFGRCWGAYHVKHYYQWFQGGVDFTLPIARPDNNFNITPKPFLTEPKKVVLTVTGREAADWPKEGTQYVFGEGDLFFAEEHQVFNESGNQLNLTVNFDENGQVTVRYRALDGNGMGGVHMKAETFY